MIYKTFKDKKISALGVGTMRLPTVDNDYSKVDLNATKEMIAFAFKNGVNYVDTAYGYHNGKATAFLYILLKVKSVSTLVISEPALELLIKNNIEVEYETKVKHIINRKGDDLCPFEKLVLEIEEPKLALELITQQLKEFNII